MLWRCVNHELLYNGGAHKQTGHHALVGDTPQSAELAAVALGLAARNTTALARAQIQGAANLERLNVGLIAITGSLDAANAQYSSLVEVSRLPGINIENSLRATLQLQALGRTGEESTRIIREFGNSLALAGTPPRELRQVVNAIRQISGEGRILQEDLSIITSRIAPIIPLMQQAFGGTRAEDVRNFYSALGTPPSQQAERFLETILEGLERLPRAGNTAANSLENLSDTVGRVQARIGSNFLPLVKEATAAIEGALMSIERSPDAARNIASLEAFAGGLLGVTSAAAGLHAAIRFLGPSLLAFATGPVGIAAAAAGAAAGAYLAWEVNLTSATEAQLRSLETEKTRLQLFREVQGLIAADDTAGLATREDALSKSVAAANKAYENQASVVSEARKALADYTQQTEQLRESPGARRGRSAERTALALRDPSELEGGLRQAEARLNALNRARLAANRIAADAAALVATAQTAVVTPSDTLDQQIDALAQSATEGSTAIARALQQIQNIDANTGEAGLKREQDIALDIGDQLVAIAEATTVKQLDAAKRRVAGLARDNSLIIENETGLQNLLLAVESQFRERKIALITAAGKEAASERIRQEIEAEREASAQGLLERQRAAQQAREQARRATTQLLTQSNEQISAVLNQLRDADVSDDQFASLNVQFETLVANLDNLGVAVPNIGRLREELAGIADLRIDDQLSGLAEVTQRNQEAAFAGAREAGQQLTRRLLEGGEAVQREFARKRIQATRQVVRQIERIESRLAQTQSVNSLERLQNDTRQLRSELQERGRAWQAYTNRVTALSRDISDSLDEALRTERLEKFQDAVADVVSDLAQTGFDFIFDSIFDRAGSAADEVKKFSDDVRGDIQLLESDIRRITRFGEDRELGAARLIEDRERARRQLQFRLREAAGQQIFGDQRALQRNIERQQDLRLSLRDRLEDFDVRIQRFSQDTALREGRLFEDAERNRERAEAPRDQAGFLEQLGRTITDAITGSLSDRIGGFIANAITSGDLTNPFDGLIETLKGLFGGDGDGTGTGDTASVPSLTAPTEALAVLTSSTPTLTAPTEAIAVLTTSVPTVTAPTEALSVLTRSTPTLIAPTESLAVLTHSTPTLIAPLASLAVLTHSTPTLTAPLTSLEVLTHSTPTIGTIPAVSIPAEAITPVLTAIPATDAVTIPANAITPVVNPVTAIDIPSNAISPTINPVSAITIPANAISPTINPVSAITIPANAISPTINPVSAITIPANAISPTINPVSAITIPANAISPTINPVSPITIPANAISPTINPVSAITIPANAITPVVNPATPITIPSHAIDPLVNAVNPITIPANAITPVVNPATAIDIPSNAIDPVINPVSPITIPAWPITPVITPVNPAQPITPTTPTGSTVNPVAPITIPHFAIDPVINPVAPIDIPVNPISLPIIPPQVTVDPPMPPPDLVSPGEGGGSGGIGGGSPDDILEMIGETGGQDQTESGAQLQTLINEREAAQQFAQALAQGLTDAAASGGLTFDLSNVDFSQALSTSAINISTVDTNIDTAKLGQTGAPVDPNISIPDFVGDGGVLDIIRGVTGISQLTDIFESVVPEGIRNAISQATSDNPITVGAATFDISGTPDILGEPLEGAVQELEAAGKATREAGKQLEGAVQELEAAGEGVRTGASELEGGASDLMGASQELKGAAGAIIDATDPMQQTVTAEVKVTEIPPVALQPAEIPAIEPVPVGLDIRPFDDSVRQIIEKLPPPPPEVVDVKVVSFPDTTRPGEFTGGEGFLQQATFFLTGKDFDFLRQPPPVPVDDNETAQAPQAPQAVRFDTQMANPPNQSESAKGLAELEDIKSFVREQAAGTETDPIYVKALEGGLDVNVVNKEDINVKVNNADDIGVQVNNKEAIPVETGVVTIVIGETPVSVRIEDLGALISQLSAGNTARDSFGGQTI